MREKVKQIEFLCRHITTYLNSKLMKKEWAFQFHLSHFLYLFIIIIIIIHLIIISLCVSNRAWSPWCLKLPPRLVQRQAKVFHSNICEQSWHMYLFRLHKRTYILSSQELTVDFMFLSPVSSIDWCSWRKSRSLHKKPHLGEWFQTAIKS